MSIFQTGILRTSIVRNRLLSDQSIELYTFPDLYTFPNQSIDIYTFSNLYMFPDQFILVAQFEQPSKTV